MERTPRPVAPAPLFEDRSGSLAVSLFRYRGGGHAELPALPGDWLSITLEGGNLLERRLEGKVERGWVRPGDVTLVPRGLASRWAPHPDATALVLQLYLPPSLMASAMQALDRDPAATTLRDVFVAPDPLLTQLGGALLRELQSGKGQGQAYIDALSHTLALHIAHHYHTNTLVSPVVLPALSAAAIRRVQEYVEAQLDQPLGIDDLAAVAALSPFHFSRVFKEATGCSPHQYVIQRRVERVRQLLPTSPLTLAQLARSVGFASQSHMTAHFRRLVGVTPAQFRRDQQRARI